MLSKLVMVLKNAALFEDVLVPSSFNFNFIYVSIGQLVIQQVKHIENIHTEHE